MKKKFFLTCCIMVLISCFTITQAGIRVVVLGSSTAQGAGPTNSENAWVNQYHEYLQSLDPTSQVINLAKGGYTTYHIMPTGHEGHPEISALIYDEEKNITKALEYKPDVIIINMPTNDVSNGVPLETQMENFATIIDLARSLDIKVWITTSQPHNYGETYNPPYGENKQPNGSKQNARNQFKQLSDMIQETYGEYCIDFYTKIATEDGYGFIKPEYDSGDGVHLNDAAHSVLFEQVKAKNIPAIVDSGSSKGILENPVYINFTASTEQVSGWNNTAGQGSGYKMDIIYDSKEELTSLSLTFLTGFTNAADHGVASSLLGMNEAISKSNFSSNGADPVIEFSGMNPSASYDFNVFASRGGSGTNRETTYTFVGKNSGSATIDASDNISSLAEITGITPDESGKITLTITKSENNNSGYSYINAMQIAASSSLPPIDIPEGAINVEEAGTLASLLPTPLEEITELVLYGALNSSDIKIIRELPALTHIDMRNTRIVSGGEAYSGSLTTIAGVMPLSMFDGNKVIESAYLPESITKIDKYVFRSCTNFKEIIIPESVVEIDDWVFYECPLTEIHIPSQVTTFGDGVFSRCRELTEITIPHGVKRLRANLFASTDKLATINLPKTIEIIEQNAFNTASGLTSITIPASTTTLGYLCFWNCRSLKTIIFEGKSLPEITGAGTNPHTPFGGNTITDCVIKVPFSAYAIYNEATEWTQSIPVESMEEIIINGSTGFNPASPEVLKTAATLSITGSLLYATDFNEFLIENNIITSIDMRGVTEYFEVLITGNPNCLFIAPENAATEEENVIINNRAKRISLTDSKPFNSPVEFTAEEVVYTRDLGVNGKSSGKEDAKGWATITLPFAPTSIMGKNKEGNLVELAPYNENGELETGKNPFWLRKITATGFSNTSAFNANTPYIICFPNHEDYQEQYNIVGEITFSASESQIKVTPHFSLTEGNEFDMTSTLNYVEQATGVYAINEEGSAFVNDLRSVNPFECYVTAKPGTNAPAMFAIGKDGSDITGLDQLIAKETAKELIYSVGNSIIIETNKSQTVSIYHISGTLIRKVEVEAGRNEITNLQRGIYIVNNQKVIL